MTTCLRKLKIYGDLAEHIEAKEIEIDVPTVAKSIQCLLAYYPKAESYMMNRYYRVFVDERPTELEEIHYPAGKGDIKIVPVISGEGGRGLGSILFGAALIFGGFMFTPLTFANFGTTTLFAGAAGFGKAAVFLGGALMLGGISQMLTPLHESQ